MRVALANELGGIDRVELGELPDPVPAAGQALVRVHGTGVGPWDVGFLGGGFPGIAPTSAGSDWKPGGSLVDAGKLRLTVQAVPLDQARRALAEVADPHTRGKIVLRIGQ